jgi:hypothetical protein
VAWVEGGFEQQVTRTTFAAEPTLVAAALEALGGASAEGAQDGDGKQPGQDGAAGKKKKSGGGEDDAEIPRLEVE